MAMIAARISSGWLASVLWKPRAVPWKLPTIEVGMPISAIDRSIAAVACDSEYPSCRLKVTVAAANWPWWFTESGVLVYS